MNFQPEARQDSIVPSSEKIFRLVVSILRSKYSRLRFLVTADDSHSPLMDRYESFALLRSEGDRLRIFKALQLLPHVDEPSLTESPQSIFQRKPVAESIGPRLDCFGIRNATEPSLVVQRSSSRT